MHSEEKGPSGYLEPETKAPCQKDQNDRLRLQNDGKRISEKTMQMTRVKFVTLWRLLHLL